MKKKPSRVRLSLDVEKTVRTTIDTLAKSMQADSITEAIRRSVLLSERLYRHAAGGGKLIFRNIDGSEKEMEVA